MRYKGMFMSIPLESVNSSDNCSICFRPMGGEEELDSDGYKIDTDAIGHPRKDGKICCYHRSCITESAKTVDGLKCWICHTKIDISSFLSLTDRSIIEMKLVAQDAFDGMTTGLMIGGGEVLIANMVGNPGIAGFSYLHRKEEAAIMQAKKAREKDGGWISLIETSAVSTLAASVVEGLSSTMAREVVNLAGRAGIRATRPVRAQAISTLAGGLMFGLTYIAVGLCQRHLFSGRSKEFHYAMVALIISYEIFSTIMDSDDDLNNY